MFYEACQNFISKYDDKQYHQEKLQVEHIYGLRYITPKWNTRGMNGGIYKSILYNQQLGLSKRLRKLYQSEVLSICKLPTALQLEIISFDIMK